MLTQQLFIVIRMEKNETIDDNEKKKSSALLKYAIFSDYSLANEYENRREHRESYACN
jgi:hypothetical protein